MSTANDTLPRDSVQSVPYVAVPAPDIGPDSLLYIGANMAEAAVALPLPGHEGYA
jgi:hypothetical protein